MFLNAVELLSVALLLFMARVITIKIADETMDKLNVKWRMVLAALLFLALYAVMRYVSVALFFK